MNRNKQTLENVYDIIDRHISNSINLVFICDYYLAEEITTYLSEVYDIDDEENGLAEDIEEYIITIDSEGTFFCENAKCSNGKYKTSDFGNEQCDYFIFTDMTEDESDKYLLSEMGTWSWNELIEDDEETEDNNCDCENCDNILDCITDRYVEQLQETCCPECTKGLLVSYLGEILDLMKDEEWSN